MYNYRNAFEKLCLSLNGLNIHSLVYIESKHFGLHPKELIAGSGISADNVIEFEVTGQNYGAHRSCSDNSNIRGITISVYLNSKIQQIVFLQKEPPCEFDESDDIYEHWKYLTSLCSLAHELGHVHDIQINGNSNFVISTKNTVNLLQAEIYAHTYCLQYLNDIAAHTAKNIMAKAIYESATKSNRFQQEVYYGICKNLGKGRIQKWIK